MLMLPEPAPRVFIRVSLRPKFADSFCYHFTQMHNPKTQATSDISFLSVQKRKRMLLVPIITTVCVLVALPVLLSLVGMLPWSRLNCWNYDIDIYSGRIRYTRFIAYISVNQRIYDSALSRELPPPDKQADWYPVNTFSPRVRHSPHYAYHAALFQIERLDALWDCGEFTPSARRAICRHILALWQTENCEAATQYLDTLVEIAEDRKGQLIDESDLSPP